VLTGVQFSCHCTRLSLIAETLNISPFMGVSTALLVAHAQIEACSAEMVRMICATVFSLDNGESLALKAHTDAR